MMLHKSKSTRNALLKYGLSAPLFAGMMILSSATISNKVEEIESGTMINTDVLAPTIITETFTKPLIPKSNAHKPNTTLIDTVPGKNKTFSNPEKSPEYPGGMGAFFTYLSKNFKHTEEARKNNVSGKIILAFVVEVDGSLSEVKVLRGLGSGLDEEAIRVLKASSKWIPGTQNGKPVRVAYTLPFAISPQGEKTGGININNKDSLVISGASKNTLYIVDGKETSVDVIKTIDPKSIKAIQVMKDETAVDKYGQKAKDGAVEIYINETPPTTTKSRIGHPGETHIRTSKSVTVTGRASGEGQKSTTINGSGTRNNEEKVVEGRAAESVTYSTKGNISITDGDMTLKGKDSKVILDGYKGLIFLDGIEIQNDKLKALDTNTFESINVLKGDSAIKKYGKRAKEGAIEITTKKK